MSSLLGRPRTRLVTPQICRKTPPPPPPPPAGTPPQTLFGAVTWIDLDPYYPAEISTTILMELQPNGSDYSGKSNGPINFIEADMIGSLPTNEWYLTLILHGLRVPPEDFMFDRFIVDITLPFDTGHLFWQNPLNPYPNDWRQARFSS